MTEQDIAKYMNRLQEEDDMLRRDQLRSFDGSMLWDEFTRRLAQEVVELPQPSSPEVFE